MSVPAAPEGKPAAPGAPQASGGGSFVRRDQLLQIEEEVQKLWAKERPYDVDRASLRRPETVVANGSSGSSGGGPQREPLSNKNKFFCTFPYPYMNGLLHLGHGYTLCRAEFQARYYRLRGKNVLWPFALHCTGMPILACADKLKREIEQKRRKKKEEENQKKSDQEVQHNTNNTHQKDKKKYTSYAQILWIRI